MKKSVILRDFKMFDKIKSFLKLTNKKEQNFVKINLIFIFVFLNIWDFAVNRSFFNGMILGILMFGPAVFLWLIGTLRAAALVTLLSILEFLMIAVFLAEGFELGGLASTLKSIFWLPYILMAAFNGFWGLKIYSEYREKKAKNGGSTV